MKRSALALILAVLMTVGLLTIGAAAEPAQTSYDDENGASFEVAAEPVTSELTAWSTGWYVVSSDVEITTRITVSGEVNLILADGCTLTAQKGISVTSGNSLSIYGQSGGSGELIAGTVGTIDTGHAGIGGVKGNTGVYVHGDITINGGSVTAQGGEWAAGIGGGSGVSTNLNDTKENGTITINGGTVNATGGDQGAGIGCGDQNRVAGGNIVITGGNVTARGGEDAAGIGGGKMARYTPGRSITISGGIVNATGGSKGAGIGNGYDDMVKRSIGVIKINGSANVTAQGGAGAAGIGSSYEGEITGAIQISGNVKVEANGGDSAGSILCAGAGIGSGGDGGKVGNITITGGTVEATGGDGSKTGSSGTRSLGGAGIGSGGSLSYNSTSNPIVINAGTITATGGTGADGIGSGAGDSKSGDFSTDRTVNGETVPGKAVIRTNSITDTDASDWNAVVFDDGVGTVYGDVTLGRALTVKKNETLTVPADSSLTVPEGKKLTVNGTLTNNGQILNYGTIDGTGTITGTQPVNNPVATYTNASGTTYYETIGDAIKASNAGGGGTVTLLKDATLEGIDKATPSYSDEISITYIRATLELDLGGNTLTCNDPIGFAVNPNVEFTIKNGTYNHDAVNSTYGTAIEGTKDMNTTPYKGCTIIIAENAIVEASDDAIVCDGSTTVNVYGKIESGNVAVYGLGPTNNITLNGAVIEADGIAVRQSAYDPDASKNRDPSNITITGSKIQAGEDAMAIYISSNEGIASDNHKLDVTDSVITGTNGIVVMGTNATISGDDTLVNAPDGYALAIANNGDGQKSVGTMTINGGTFIGLIEVLEPAADGTAITMGDGYYLVTIDNGDGTPLKSEVIKTSSYTLPEAPTWDGYKFQGWYDGTKLYVAEENVPITGNTTFTARWIKTDAAYSLSLTPTSLNLLDVGSDTITVSAVVPDGYKLVMTNSNGSVADAVMSEDGKTITVTAKNAGSTTISVSIVSEDGVVTLETETCNVVVGPSYAITIVYGNGTGNKTEYIAQGDDYRLPAAPSKPGYIFMGWKCSDGHTHQAGEVVTVDGDMTFTAVWANMPDITPGGDDEPVVPDFPFTDVREGQWFYEAVKYVYSEGIMNGMDRYTFAPNGSLTRAMVWTMLARLDGVDTEGGATWYSKAQDWAMSLDVSDGTNPMGEITRQELVTMLWRYAYVCDADMTLGDDTNILSYIDIDKVSDWAVEAFQWCCGAGIIEGDENGALNPTAGCTRAEAAAMFMRLCKNVDLSPTV